MRRKNRKSRSALSSDELENHQTDRVARYLEFMKKFDGVKIGKKFTREEINERRKGAKKFSSTFETVAEKFSKEAKKI